MTPSPTTGRRSSTSPSRTTTRRRVVAVQQGQHDDHDSSTDLDGKKIGVCSGCTYESVPRQRPGTSTGYTFDFVDRRRRGLRLRHRHDGMQDLALGDGPARRGDHARSTTAQGCIDAGKPMKIVGDPVFYEPLAVAIDKSSHAGPDEPRRRRSSEIVGEMHDDGTLTEAVEEVVRHGPDRSAVRLGAEAGRHGRTTGVGRSPDDRVGAEPGGAPRAVSTRSRSALKVGARLGRDLPDARLRLRRRRLRHRSGCATSSTFILGGHPVHDLHRRRAASCWRSMLALLGALGRLSRNPIAYGVSGFYISFFRGTPLIVQMFLIYLALPQIGTQPARELPWLPTGFRTCARSRRGHRGHPRARPQLRRLHDRDLPGRASSRWPAARARPPTRSGMTYGRRCARSCCRRRSG